MAVNPTYPGVYIEEIPSGVHTIVGVATSITAFLGQAPHGPANQAVHVLSLKEYERNFGGLSSASEMSYAVSQFFLNGGSDAWIVRLAKNAVAATMTLQDGSSPAKNVLKITSLNKGLSSNAISVLVTKGTVDPTHAFDLTFIYAPADDLANSQTETFQNLSMDPKSVRFVEDMINDISQLVTVSVLAAAGTVPNPPAEQKPSAGSLLSGSFGDTDLDALPSDPKNSFQISLNGGAFTDIAIGKNAASGADLAAKLKDVAARIQKAVQDVKPGIDAWRNFTCVVDGNQLLLTSGTMGANSSVHVHEAAVAANSIANELHLLEAGASKATATAGANPSLSGGNEDTFDINNDGLNVIFPSDPARVDAGEGIFALDKVDLFNLLCIPGVTNATVIANAIVYCEERRAFMLVDPPLVTQNPPLTLARDKMVDYINGPNLPKGSPGTYAAIYYPRIKVADPLLNGKIRSFAPCGTMAGLYARTDAARGVWKAPAGTDATLVGVQGLDQQLNDNDNGVLNPHGVNCLRIFPVYGAVSWGARTVSGDDQISSDYKYVPVRRTALFIEESLYRGLKWAVFEPNDEPLWASIRLNAGAFMHDLFVKGAFQGSTPRDAYFVKCDKETTTQNDINLGIVNVLIGFAPLKPAEFVIVQLQQIAGQIQV